MPLIEVRLAMIYTYWLLKYARRWGLRRVDLERQTDYIPYKALRAFIFHIDDFFLFSHKQVGASRVEAGGKALLWYACLP